MAPSALPPKSFSLNGDCLARLLLVLLVVQRTAEEHDVGFRAVDRVVDPPTRLLDPERAPLGLRARRAGHAPRRQPPRRSRWTCGDTEWVHGGGIAWRACCWFSLN